MDTFKSSNLAQVCDNCGARHPEEKSCLKFWINYSMEKLNAEVDLSRENKRLRGALEFYADTKSWTLAKDALVTFPVINPGDLSDAFSESEILCMFGGKRAREALKEKE